MVSPDVTYIRDDYLLGGQKIPLLDGYDWTIASTKLTRQRVKELLAVNPSVTLRWVKQDHVGDLYIPDMKTEEFLTKTGLHLSLKKGAYVKSKRLSRVMSPYYYWGFFTDLDVYHDPSMDKKQYDGFGYMHPRVLPRLLAHLPPAKAERLTKELLKTKRFSLTLVGPWGEDKGHVVLKDDLEHDLVLPCDSKTEVMLDRVLLAVRPIHARNWMYIDAQSLVNLHPFIKPEQYLEWLERDGEMFLKSINDKKWKQLALKLPQKSRDGWWMMEYLAKGYDVMWFQGAIKALGRIHETKVMNRTTKKLRFPIPGASYYVSIAKHAGMKLKTGCIRVDPTTASAYLSDADWNELSAKLGGMDFDDMLWLLGFTNHDGNKKVLVWRSPNQVGEYTVLRPVGKFPPQWTWPTLDSRELPVAKDHTYLDLIPKSKIVDEPYTVKAMSDAILAAEENKGAIGMTVNLQIVLKAIVGELPDTLPARLEDVMDASAKLGQSLSLVKAWCQGYANQFVFKNPLIPRAVLGRIENMLTAEAREKIVIDEDHWLEVLLKGVQTHMKRYNENLQQMAEMAMPPVEVLEYGLSHLKQAAEFKQLWFNISNEARLTPNIGDVDWDVAKTKMEAQFWKYPTDQWTKIMAAIAVRSYLVGDHISSDGAMWLIGKAGKRGLVHVSLKMLEECKPKLGGDRAVRINHAWFSTAKALRQKDGKPSPDKQSGFSVEERAHYKGLVAQWAKEGKYNRQMKAVRRDDGKVEIYLNDHLFGFLEPGQSKRVGETFELIYGMVADGNLYGVIK